MESIKYIKNNLNILFSKLSYLEIQYEYRSYMKLHIIQIKPTYCFESDTNYKFKQIELEDTFEAMFPNEEILFISENDLIQIEAPIFELGTSSLENINSNFAMVIQPTEIENNELSIQNIFYTECINSFSTYTIGNDSSLVFDHWNTKFNCENNISHFASKFFKLRTKSNFKKTNKATEKKDLENIQGLFFLLIL